MEFGYLGLFIIAFISATLIPAATEVFLLAMTGVGYSMVGILIVATAGNFLGAVFNYTLGWRGINFIQKSRFAPKPEHIDRAQSLFKRWGTPILFFSWIPFIGDPLTVVAGIVRTPLRSFLVLVLAGRFLRYAAILFAGNAAVNWIL